MVDYACTYNGTTFGGAGATMQILDAKGLEDLPDMRSGDQDRPNAHGQFPGLDVAGGRTVTFTLQAFPTSGSLATTLEAFKAATVPQTAEQPLTFTLPGRSARRIYCRPRRREFPVDQQYDSRAAIGAAEFHATDPRIYDDSTTTATASVPTGEGTVGFNVTFPLTFTVPASFASGQVAVSNSGNVDAPWVAQMVGPLTNPRIQNLTTGQAIQLAGTVPDGTSVTIDTSARTALWQDGTSAIALVSGLTTWFGLPPGSTTLQFRASAGTGSLVVVFRSAWM